MKEATLILASGKCSWGQCYACGWGRLEGNMTEPELKEAVEKRDIKDADVLKVFASGSFLDDAQFTPEFRAWFAERVKKEGVKHLIVESRPEYITDKTLADFKGIKLTVAIGLESAVDSVLKRYNKGFTLADYLKAVSILRKNNCGVRTYIMVNMPFSTHKDLQATVKVASETADSVVVINTFPHSKAPLFDLWVEGKWRPMNRDEFEAEIAEFKKDKKLEFDYQNYMFVPKFPPEGRIAIQGATSEVLNHPYFNIWQDYLQRFYEPPKKPILLFLPCSFRKPYFKSQTHERIHHALKQAGVERDVHKVVVSNPGVVPIEYANYYPFNAYDWPEWEETPAIKEEYIKVNQERVKLFLKAHAKNYKKIVCYYKPGSETAKAVIGAGKELGIDIENMLRKETYDIIKDEKNPISRPEALASLKTKIKEI